jgi:2,3-bisphosphoglycerate-dependent phosphoglycerate mutase
LPKLILVRHGQSQWNRENRFTGWTDVDLSDQGRAEARQAGRLIRAQGLAPSAAFTSVLKRAVRTLWLVLEELDAMWLAYRTTWRLNERHYGALQGLDKAETARRYGEEQVRLWRRSYHTRPPLLELNDPRHPRHDPRYQGPDAGGLPAGESLADTLARLMPCWREELAPALRAGREVLIAAHGNSLRAVVKHLEGVADADIPGVEIPTGNPLVYELDPGLAVVSRRYLDPGRAAPLPGRPG